MSTSHELVRLTAREAVAALRKREVAPAELIDTAASRIAAANGTVNALPTLCLDRARDAAKRLPPARADASWLAGLPLAITALSEVAGVRTTYGSPIFANHVPNRSAITVERLGPMAASSSPRPTPRNSAPAPTPSTRCSAAR